MFAAFHNQSPLITMVRHFNPEHICIVTTKLIKFSCCSCFKFNRVWSLNKWPTRFICLVRSMDTVLWGWRRWKRKALRVSFCLIDVYFSYLFNVRWFPLMKHFRSLPLITFKTPWPFERCFQEGMGETRQNYDTTSEQQSVTSVTFHGHLFNFLYVNQIDSLLTADVFPTKLNAITQS